MFRSSILALLFACLASVSVMAQSYQTSFSEVKFDRAKGPATVHGGVEVEGATGAVSLSIPFGPGIGTRGISFRPSLSGRMAPQLIGSMKSTSTGTRYQTLTEPGAGLFSLSPGVFDLALSQDTLNDDEGLVITNYSLPGGGSGSFNLNVVDGGPLPSPAEINALLQRFRYTSGETYGSAPWRTGQSTTPFIRRDDSAKLVIGLGGSVAETVLANTSANGSQGGIPSDQWHIPTKILVVQGEVAYEYVYQAANYKRTEDPLNVPAITWANVLRSGHYVLSSIRNRFGESVDFFYGYDGVGYSAEWKQGGNSTGVRVLVDSIVGGAITDPATGGQVNPVSLRITYEGVSPSPTITLSGHHLGWWSSREAPGDWRLGIRPSQVTFVDTQETIGFTYAAGAVVGYNGASMGARQVLTAVNFPTHQMNLSWTTYPYLRNPSYPGIWGGYAPFSSPYYLGFAYGVNRVDDTDLATNRVYTTIHTRTLPQPDFGAAFPWSNRAFYDVVQHPDGALTLTRFVEPVASPNAGWSGDSENNKMQTMAHLKHLVSEVREYAIGTSVAQAQADLANAPAQSSAFKIISSDRWDLHSAGNPTGSYTYSAVPHPTRSRTWTKESSVLVSEEHAEWDPVSLGWKKQHRQVELLGLPDLAYSLANVRSLAHTGNAPGYPTAAGAVYRTTANQFETVLSQWFLGRSLQSQETAQQDGTGNGVTPLPSALPSATKSYENDFNRVNSVKVTASDGSSFVQTAFGFVGNGLNSLTSSQVQNVTLTGSGGLALSGQVGIELYQYNSFGFMSYIKPKLGSGEGPWNLQQSLDGFGRPTSQTDANNKVTSYGWDGVGRLLSIQPPDGMVSTTITYNDTDHRGIVLTRGAQWSEYRYDGMGRLVLMRRSDGGSQSYKVFSYDLGGRKTFESVWIAGSGSDTTGLNPSGLTGDRWEYNDGQGRVTDHTAANGIKTHTTYLGLVQTVTVGYGSSVPATTTYTSDAQGRLVQVTDPQGQVTTHKYDLANRIAEVHQVAQVRTWKYHPLGWLQELTQPESGTTTYGGFTVAGSPTVTSYMGDGTTAARVVSTAFDPLMRPLSIWSSDGTVDQSFQYDDGSGAHGAAMNRLWYARDRGTERVNFFSGLGGAMSRLDTNVWTGGALYMGTLQHFPQTFTTDTYGHRVQATAGQSVVTTTYDLAKDVPISLSRNGSAVMAVTGWQSASWNPTQLSYGNGAITTQSFDVDQARLSTMKHYASNAGGTPTAQWTYSYDGRGNLLGDGEDSYTYDPLNRLTKAIVQWSGGSLTQNYTFDSFGNLTSKVATGNLPSSSIACANLNNFTLNGAEQATMAATNRLPQYASNVPTGALYDGQGNLTQLYTQAGQSGTQVNAAYDALGRVTQLIDTKRGVLEKYAYNTEGLRTLVQVYQGGTLQGTKVNLYNDQRQMVSQYTAGTQFRALARTATQTRVMALTKLPAGASIDSPGNGSTFSVGQVIQFQGSTDGGTTFLWNFGTAPNATGLSPTHTYTTPGTYTVTFTASATTATTSKATITLNIVSTPTAPTISSFTASPASITVGGSSTLAWSVQGATTVALNGQAVSGTSQAVAPTVVTLYTLTATNALGSVTKTLTVTVNDGGPLAWARDVTYMGTKEAAEFDSAGMHVTHLDHLGSPRLITGASGAIESRQKYTPYGETLDLSNPQVAKGFTNHEQTDPSGLIYMQARLFAPGYGRFLSPDPARDQHFELTQSWNIYSYVQNNPTISIDPTGMYDYPSNATAREKEWFEDNLKRAGTALNSPNLNSEQKGEIKRSLDALGKPGDGNGLTVAFGKLEDAAASVKTSGFTGSGDGFKVLAKATFDIDNLATDKQAAAAITHEGSHFADKQDALAKVDMATQNVAASPSNTTIEKSETRAYKVSLYSMVGTPTSPGEKQFKPGGSLLYDPKASAATNLNNGSANIKNVVANPKNLLPENRNKLILE